MNVRMNGPNSALTVPISDGSVRHDLGVRRHNYRLNLMLCLCLNLILCLSLSLNPGSVFAIWLYNLFVNLLIEDFRLGRRSFGPEYLHDQQSVSFGKFV